MANIRAIAKKAGVSISTVSRVLNNVSGVSEEARDAVLAVVTATGYSPEVGRRSTSNIAIVYTANPTLESPFDAALLIGIGEVGVRGVTGLISFLWVLLTIGVGYGLASVLSGWTALIVVIILCGTMLSLLAAFTTFIRMAYYTCLYLWAADVEKQGQSAPAPLPLAIALGHRESARRAA